MEKFRIDFPISQHISKLCFLFCFLNAKNFCCLKNFSFHIYCKKYKFFKIFYYLLSRQKLKPKILYLIKNKLSSQVNFGVEKKGHKKIKDLMNLIGWKLLDF